MRRDPLGLVLPAQLRVQQRDEVDADRPLLNGLLEYLVQPSAYLLPGVGHAALYVAEEFKQLGPGNLGDRLVPECGRDVVLERIDPVGRALRVPFRLDEFLVIGAGHAGERRLLLLLLGLALAARPPDWPQRALLRSSMGSRGGSAASKARCFAARSRAKVRLSPAALALCRAHPPRPISRRLPVALVYRNTHAALGPEQRSSSPPPSDISLSRAFSTSRADSRLSFAPSSRVAIRHSLSYPPVDPPENRA